MTDTDKENQNKESQENQQDNEKPTIPTTVKLTGRMLNFTRLQLQGDEIDSVLNKVSEKLGKKLDSKLLVVVSFDSDIKLTKLWQGLWDLGLQPIGIIPKNDEQQQQAVDNNIAIFPADGQRIDGKSKDGKSKNVVVQKSSDEPQKSDDKPNDNTDNKPNEQSAEANTETSDNQEKQSDLTAQTTDILTNENQNNDEPSNKLNISPDTDYTQNVEGDLVYHQIVRSGQSINHVGGDVILTKGINAGAEAITDYSLHIYGKAEGRLVAGATGDKNARIFCLKFNPSLVSVAGTYCLKENIPTELLNKAVEVSFADEQGLVFSLME
nr:septum site-determining protein MinC [uncultured Moraxella sp.]